MRHRIANIEDSEALGELNHQLNKDEGHRNSMTIPELIERMRSWLITDYRASIFEDDTGILAYALYRRSALPLAPMVSVPGFKTKRLILKPLSLDDIPSYETHFIDYEVIRHLSAVVPWPYPRNGVSEFFQNVLLSPSSLNANHDSKTLFCSRRIARGSSPKFL